jgi:hypothetical protein
VFTDLHEACKQVPALPHGPIMSLLWLLSLLGGMMVVARPFVDEPLDFPLYAQCDPQWADDVMVTTTICLEGCAMSCLAMAMAGVGAGVEGQVANPHTLNAWLAVNNG